MTAKDELEDTKALISHLQKASDELEKKWRAAMKEFDALPVEQRTPEKLKELGKACLDFSKGFSDLALKLADLQSSHPSKQ